VDANCIPLSSSIKLKVAAIRKKAVKEIPHHMAQEFQKV